MHQDILGIHYGHDATVALIRDGVLLEAMSEERLSRAKKHSGFPHLALKYIIKKYSIDKVQLVTVVGHTFSPIYKKTKKENLEERARSRFSDDFIRALGARFPLIGSVIKARYVVLETIRNSGMESFIKKDIQSRFPGAAVSYIEHHHAHAWCAPLFVDNATDKKIILTLDGAGDMLSGTISFFDGKEVRIDSPIPVYSSLGLLYSAITDILGMSRNEHEFKVMGLAPYAKATSGEKVYEKLKKLVWFDEE
ncbi:MAG: hypothetical protein RI935_749, partial [Candidatus Parcubacteria bacterium]